MKIYWLTILCAILFFGASRSVLAVPPPDFVFNVGQQVAQIFSFLVLGFSVVLGALRRFFQTSPLFVKHGKLMWLVMALLVILLSALLASFYSNYKQQSEYTSWVTESKQQAALTDGAEELDLLKVGVFVPIVNARGEIQEDAGAAFIRTYYNNLSAGKLEEAYAVSVKTVPFETYKTWYKDTLSLTVDSLQKISDNSYSLGLTLSETNGTTRYAVLMKLKKENGYRIESSDVRILAEAGSGARLLASNGEFFRANNHLSLSVSNEEFKTLSAGQMFVLDAREDEEFAIGRFTGSTHIRFADLLAGEWIRVPDDRVVYIICWSGIRGREVAEFLRTKNIAARYLENGADGWVNFGGQWSGGIKFLSRYTADQYTLTFTTEEVKQSLEQGIFLVDSRQPAKYQQSHIPGSVNIPIIYTPTSQMPTALSQVPPNSKVITICDDFVSCFDAKVTGVKLEKEGHTFLGRYNQPWEYK